MKSRSIKLAFLFAVLTGIGMSYHHPVTPTLFTELGLPARIFGNASAILCFFTFLTAPFWGELCGIMGRVKVFTVTCICYGFGQFILGEATTEAGVLFARMLSGIFSGGVTIASMLYIIDVSWEKNKGRNVALYTAVQTVSSSFGYLFGGLIGTYFHYRYSFIVQGFWMITLGILSYFLQEESCLDIVKIKTSQLVAKANPFRAFINAGSLLNRITCFFFIAVTLTGFALACYDNAFNYYLKDQLDFIPAYNGILKATIGLVGLGANFSITLWILKRKHLARNLTLVLLINTITAVLAVVNGGLIYFVIVNLVFFTANSIYQPLQRSLSVAGRSVREAELAVGLYNSMVNAGNVFGGIFAGIAYSYHVKAPFVLSSIIFLLAVCSSYVYYKRDRSEKNL